MLFEWCRRGVTGGLLLAVLTAGPVWATAAPEGEWLALADLDADAEQHEAMEQLLRDVPDDEREALRERMREMTAEERQALFRQLREEGRVGNGYGRGFEQRRGE